MREYGRIQTGFWNHPKIRGCSDRAKLLANYLMTGPHSNACGAYLLPDAYVSDDLGWDMKAVAKAFAELFAIGFCERFADNRHIVVCDFLDWNPIENPNVGKAILKQIDQLPTDRAARHVRAGLEQYAKQFPNGLETVFERFAKEFRIPNLTEPEPEPDISPQPEAARQKRVRSEHGLNGHEPDFEEFWLAFPRRVNRGQAVRAYLRALARASPAQLLAGAKAYASLRAGEDEQFTQHPATWLNADAWLNGDLPAPVDAGKAAEQQEKADRLLKRGKYAEGMN